MSIKSSYETVCTTCGGVVHEGDSVEWKRGVKGVRHTACPAVPETPPRKVTFTKVGETWALRVFDPEDATSLEGETVTVVKRSGETQEKTLGRLVERDGVTNAVYLIASDAVTQEDLPAVPRGLYAVEVDGALLIVKVVEFRNGTTRVFDADEWGKEYAAKTVLEAIDTAGVGACAQAYGRLRGRCCRCNAVLSKRLSIEVAIGPTCGKHYWDRETWTKLKADARAKLRAEGLDPEEVVVSEDLEPVVNGGLPVSQFEAPGTGWGPDAMQEKERQEDEQVAHDKAVRDKLAEFGVDLDLATPKLLEAVDALVRKALES